MMLGLITMCGCLPVALFVKSAQLLSAVNSVSMAFLLFFCCITALLPFSPTHTGGWLCGGLLCGGGGGNGVWCVGLRAAGAPTC